MGRRWQSDRKREHYYRKAKKEHYRSRAAYKLKQINDNFDVMRPGSRVVDLGASPGGWSQIAAEIVGSTGKVVSVDIRRMRRIDGVEFILGDVRERKTIDRLSEIMGGSVDVVLSDMSPNISGHYSTDHAKSIELCEHALKFAEAALREDGCFIVKVFEGDLYPEFLAKVKRHFKSVKGHSPRASRASSSEIYIIAKGFISRTPPSIV